MNESLQINSKADLVQEYLRLTRDVMPALAQQIEAEPSMAGKKKWPVKHDHCFQRIVLDNICGGAWYDHIKAPAYRHLSAVQASSAVLLCRQIMSGQADLNQLNQRSLKWRQKQYQFSF